ncbi:hypothetical protein PsorP6_001740 [Peronosclerospora sorghi]|uniref:Uncharacterized protein n=1 Tax=Peronosclerospora sorghi TaxID=230839 RepID=A0ACC0WYJ7_9STRA|nr:hypothetical protein PsorP6_001740 [Peronosclerospora sorghi]
MGNNRKGHDSEGAESRSVTSGRLQIEKVNKVDRIVKFTSSLSNNAHCMFAEARDCNVKLSIFQYTYDEMECKVSVKCVGINPVTFGM